MSAMSEWEEGRSEQHVGMRRLSEYNNPEINCSNCMCNTQYTVSSCWFRDCYIPTVFSFRRAAHSYPLLIPTWRSFQHAAHSDMLLIPLIPTLFLHFFDLSSLHPFSFLNVLSMICQPRIRFPLGRLWFENMARPWQPIKTQMNTSWALNNFTGWVNACNKSKEDKQKYRRSAHYPL